MVAGMADSTRTLLGDMDPQPPLADLSRRLCKGCKMPRLFVSGARPIGGGLWKCGDCFDPEADVEKRD